MLGLGLTAMVVAAMLLFPDTTLGREIRRRLVEAPARALDRIRPGKTLFYAVLAIVGLTLTLLFEAEGLRLFGLMLPETMMWFVMFDVGVFVDALLITATILASNGLRVARARVSALPRQATAWIRRRAGRARRSPSRPPRPGPADEDGPGWAIQPPYFAFSMA